jgi:hypothetical protein
VFLVAAPIAALALIVVLALREVPLRGKPIPPTTVVGPRIGEGRAATHP